GPPSRTGMGGGDDDDGSACAEGTVRCSGLTAQTCRGGVFVDNEACATGCADGVGCSACTPGTGTCSGTTSHTCADDGSGFVDSECDPVQGMGCDAATGQCTGACAAGNIGASYIGCEYYATVTGNTVGEAFHFAVAVSNTSGDPADVT